jgi:hypothetical protein
MWVLKSQETLQDQQERLGQQDQQDLRGQLVLQDQQGRLIPHQFPQRHQVLKVQLEELQDLLVLLQVKEHMALVEEVALVDIQVQVGLELVVMQEHPDPHRLLEAQEEPEDLVQPAQQGQLEIQAILEALGALVVLVVRVEPEVLE